MRVRTRTIDAFERDLRKLGVDPRNASVLLLLPLIFVAWSDGTMEQLEQRRILELAHLQLDLDASSTRLISNWLSRPPTPAYFRLGLRVLRELACAPDTVEVELEDLHRSIVYAESVARATADSPDSPWAPKPVEERALRRAATALGVDLGLSWAGLLRELGEPR